MNDFKVGDTVYWIDNPHQDPRDDYLNLDYIGILYGVILLVDKNFYKIKTDNCTRIVIFNNVYKSKQDCIDAFKKRLDEL